MYLHIYVLTHRACLCEQHLGVQGEQKNMQWKRNMHQRIASILHQEIYVFHEH